MTDVVTQAGQVTPAWLAPRLAAWGPVPDVRAIESEPVMTTLGATLWRLRVTHAGDAQHGVPTNLLLKCSRLDQDGRALLPQAGAHEVDFYARLAPGMPAGLVPRCLDAAVSPAGTWHLLLEDLSGTHRPPVFPLPPSDADCVRAVRALARVHAAWWQAPRLGLDTGTPWTVRAIDRLVRDTEQVVAVFLEYLGDALSPRRRRIYERLLAIQPELRRRQLARPLTLTHGDAHWGNFLFPHDPDVGVAALVDWQLREIAPAANDLAYHLALWSFPERRQRLEQPLLRAYHAELVGRGVSDYPWETCWADYRLFVAKLPLGAAWMWHRRLAPLVWWDSLERALLAFDDLECGTLLDDVAAGLRTGS